MKVSIVRTIVKYVFLLPLIFLKVSIFANTLNDTNGLNMEEVSNILSIMSEVYKSYDNFKVKFKFQRKETELGIIEKSVGIFVCSDLKKREIDNKYILDIGNILTVCDGKTKWVYVKSINEVTITGVGDDDDDDRIISRIKNILFFPTEWLTPVLYEKKDNTDFIELIPYEDTNFSDNQEIEIKDKDFNNSEGIEIERVTLELDHKSKKLISWRIDTIDGTQLVYEIKKIKPNLKLDSNFFKFDVSKYKNIIINDLRE